MAEQPAAELITKQDATLSRDIAIARRIRSPRPVPYDAGAQGISRSDILFALFKHKKKIIGGTIFGLLAAAGVYCFYPATYQSDAKLLVRYLVERSTIDPTDSPRNPGGYAPATDSVIGSEIEILASWDLAVQTAEAIGPKRLLPRAKGTPTKELAAGVITSGLELTSHKGTNIILVSYRNRDAELATSVLNELVNRYFNKHLEVHRSAGAFDFVTQQTDQVRARLNQTEDALKDLKGKAGIVSLADATKAVNIESEKIQEQLHEAEAELAEQQARVRQINGSVGGVTIIPGDDAKPSDANTKADSSQSLAPSPTPSPAPAEAIQKYQALTAGLQKLHQTQLDLFGKYTPESQMVKANQAEIDDVERQIHNLEKKYPDLPSRIGSYGSSRGNELNPAAETARLAGLRAKKEALAARLHDAQQRMEQLSRIEPQIVDLERQKQLQEDNYKYFQATLEKARVDEALDPAKIPNISAVQRPSPPMLVTKTRNKLMLGAGVSGLALLVAFALLKELYLSGTIRRAVEIEKFVGISPLMSIPFTYRAEVGASFKANGKNHGQKAGSTTRSNLAPWDKGHFIRPFSEAIRDRLGLYFELHNLTHKPKLVGVAGVGNGAGTSTLAAGLAAALSETNDGKVLLVDVSLGPDQVHPFFKGKPAYTLNAALQTESNIDAAAENLYLAKVASSNAGPAQLGLKKFFDLMPNLKASDFDYIIFDMPSLYQTSPTWGMAPFMDRMLLVAEAEKSSREVMKRSCRKLIGERDNIAVVLNKTRSYGSKSLELE